MRLFNDETAPHQLAFEAFGVELRVCASSHELLERAEPYLPPGFRRRQASEEQFPLAIIEDEAEGSYLVWKGTTCVSEGQGLEHSLTVLESQIRGQVAIRAPA